MTDSAALRLVELDEGDFDWLLSGGPAPRNGLVLPPGGVDEPETLRHVRRLTQRLHEAGLRSSWMAVVADEVVGLIGHKAPPSTEGSVEIGYGVAASRRGRGYATQAVSAVIALARRDASLHAVAAETVEDNLASQRVLLKNGFARSGRRVDPQDGPLVLWRIAVAATES